MITSIVIGSITLNTPTDSGAGYALTATTGLETPPVRFASFALAGANGGRFVSAFYAPRRFSLQGMVIGADVDDFLQKRDLLIAAFAGGQAEQELVITRSDGLALRIVAAMTTLDMPPQAGVPTAAAFRVEFEAANPFFESAIALTYALALATGGGAKVPPDTMPAAIAFGSGGAVSVFNDGSAPAQPAVRINGPITNPALRNGDSDEELSFAIDLADGEYLDLDFRNKTVTDETGRNRYDTKGGEWWELEPGVTPVRLIADSDDPSAVATMSVRDTYLNA